MKSKQHDEDHRSVAAEGMDAFHDVFLSGHALFYLESIGSLKKLHNMDAELGVPPYPKLDESQAG